MTAYPVTTIVDYEDAHRTSITIEEATDSDAEGGAVAVLLIDREDIRLRIALSPEACRVLERALRETRR